MPSVDSQRAFRSAVVDQTTTVLAGYLTKPHPVYAEVREQGTFIHISSTMDWLCRAVTGNGRKLSPLKDCSTFMNKLASITLGWEPKVSASAETEVDPMQELFDESATSDDPAQSDSKFVTPKKKRPKRALTAAEGEFITIVPLRDVLTDLDVFDGEDKTNSTFGTLPHSTLSPCFLTRSSPPRPIKPIRKHHHNKTRGQ